MERPQKHHMLFERSWYRGDELLWQLRGRFIAPIRSTNHRALHAAIEPPPIPRRWMAADLLDAARSEKPDLGIESFEFAEDWFAMAAIDYANGYMQDDQERLMGIANNIARQLSFLRGSHE